MIRLKRIRSENVIHHNFYGKRKQAFEKELLLNQRRIRRGNIEKHNFKSARWKPAKEQLFAETGGKCAYCEAPTSVVAFGDVEHYRPKSLYWWLAYCYDNYLASCQLCNQRFKKDVFPIQNRKMPAPVIRRNTTNDFIEAKAGQIAPDPLDADQVDAFIRLHQQERPLLLNPYFDEPAEYFAWHADDVLREVEITANRESPRLEIVVNPENPDLEPIAAASIQYYGLNRKELKALRYDFYRSYSVFRITLENDRSPPEIRNEIRNTIERMKSPGAPFAGMIRYFDAPFSVSER